MAYPGSDTCCGCIDSTSGTLLIAIYSLLRVVGPLVYLLLPVCQHVHGGDGGFGYVLLVLKLLEVVSSIAHAIIGIWLAVALIRVLDSEDTLRPTFVYMTIVVASLLLLYWLLHFCNALAKGCTFCASYVGDPTSAPFTLKNGYNERLCKDWKTTNKHGWWLVAIFPLAAIIESLLLLYCAAVVQGLEYY